MKNKPLPLTTLVSICIIMAFSLTGCTQPVPTTPDKHEKGAESEVEEVITLTDEERLKEAQKAAEKLQQIQDMILEDEVNKEYFIDIVDKEDYPISQRSIKMLELKNRWLREVNFESLNPDDQTEAYLSSLLSVIEFQSSQKKTPKTLEPVKSEDISVSDDGLTAEFASTSTVEPAFKTLKLVKVDDKWMVDAESFLGLHSATDE